MSADRDRTAARPAPSSRRPARACVAAMLAVHAILQAWGAWRDAPTIDEVAYLAAGLSHWQYGRFDLANVSPPLVRMVAALPVIAAAPRYNWRRYESHPAGRVAHGVGRDFIAANGPRTFWLFALARFACISFSLVGGYFCYRWARELYGTRPGLLAAALWCFSPDILGHGQLLSPDVGVTALSVVAGYAFWRWLAAPAWSRAFGAGCTLGLAELAKTNAIVFFLLWPLIWLVWNFKTVRGWRNWFGRGAQLATILALGLYVLNLGYGFEGSFQTLGNYWFRSRLLSQNDYGGNRFAGSIVGRLPVPVPSNYLAGIDVQRSDFENVHGDEKSYIRGQWSEHGWWWYYFYVLAVKEPLGTWGLIGLTVMARMARAGRSSGRASGWRDEFALLAPGLALFALASSQTGFSHHLRYVLPALPFAWIWASQTAAPSFFAGRKWLSYSAGLMVVWAIGGSLWICPHSLAYFNELAGGPLNGDFHLQDSNIDWGEDLLYLKRWIDTHPQARPLYVAYWGFVDPAVAGIEFPEPPLNSWRKGAVERPPAGWYAISVKCLRGDHRFGLDAKWFFPLKPVDRIGYSIRVYHLESQAPDRWSASGSK